MFSFHLFNARSSVKSMSVKSTLFLYGPLPVQGPRAKLKCLGDDIGYLWELQTRLFYVMSSRQVRDNNSDKNNSVQDMVGERQEGSSSVGSSSVG